MTGRPFNSKVAIGAGIGQLLIAAALTAMRIVGGTPEIRAAEGPLAPAAFFAVLGAPGALAALAGRGRPALAPAAAAAMVPLSLISLAGVALPMLVPATVLFVVTVRTRSIPRPRVPAALVGFAFVGLLFAAFTALYVTADPISYDRPGGGGGSASDHIRPVESLASLALTAVAVTTATIGATPRRRLLHHPMYDDARGSHPDPPR